MISNVNDVEGGSSNFLSFYLKAGVIKRLKCHAI